MQTPLEKRLWSKVDKSGGAEACWWWQAAIAGGYGVIFLRKEENGRRRLAQAHRIVYELLIGPIPINKVLCHHCDNKLCVNPKHMFIGTEEDNAKDASLKGLLVPKSQDPRLRLDEATIKEIRNKASNGASLAKMARRYGVSVTAIFHIVHYDTWKHVS